jgi:hypothetical protein
MVAQCRAMNVESRQYQTIASQYTYELRSASQRLHAIAFCHRMHSLQLTYTAMHVRNHVRSLAQRVPVDAASMRLVPCHYAAARASNLMLHLIHMHAEVDSLLVKRRDERLKEYTCQYPGCKQSAIASCTLKANSNLKTHIKLKKHRMPQCGGAAGDQHKGDADEE